MSEEYAAVHARFAPDGGTIQMIARVGTPTKDYPVTMRRTVSQALQAEAEACLSQRLSLFFSGMGMVWSKPKPVFPPQAILNLPKLKIWLLRNCRGLFHSSKVCLGLSLRQALCRTFQICPALRCFRICFFPRGAVCLGCSALPKREVQRPRDVPAILARLSVPALLCGLQELWGFGTVSLFQRPSQQLP